jgi:Lrp/AsnC family leucine-responsive transcriptional regulator
MDPELTSIDWSILEALRANARISMVELAEQVHLSRPAVTQRVRRLEKAGIITGYRADIDWERLGFGIKAIVHLRSGYRNHEDVVQAITRIPEVAQVHITAGETFLTLMMYARDIEHLREAVKGLLRYGDTTTAIVYDTRKSALHVDDQLRLRLSPPDEI